MSDTPYFDEYLRRKKVKDYHEFYMYSPSKSTAFIELRNFCKEIELNSPGYRYIFQDTNSRIKYRCEFTPLI